MRAVLGAVGWVSVASAEFESVELLKCLKDDRLISSATKESEGEEG
jgi:hypothetical protein